VQLVQAAHAGTDDDELTLGCLATLFPNSQIVDQNALLGQASPAMAGLDQGQNQFEATS
jgi:hypothetical protein